jgi:hypothetical protein
MSTPFDPDNTNLVTVAFRNSKKDGLQEIMLDVREVVCWEVNKTVSVVAHRTVDVWDAKFYLKSLEIPLVYRFWQREDLEGFLFELQYLKEKLHNPDLT